MVKQTRDPSNPTQYRVILAAATDAPIHYTLDGNPPTSASPRYSTPVVLDAPTTVSAVAILKGKPLSPPTRRKYWVTRAIGAEVEYLIPHSTQYAGEGARTLVNGVRGSSMHGDGQWQGFDGTDMDVVLDLGRTVEAQTGQVGFLDSPGSWIMLPQEVSFSISTDGKNFQSLHSLMIQDAEHAHAPVVRTIEVDLEGNPFRFLRILAKNFGELPRGHPGEGKPAWLFVDEILVD
jgi:hexosaminidase